MSAKSRRFGRLSRAAIVLCLGLIFSLLITAQAAAQRRQGTVDDWSFHHLLFSNPGTYDQVIANGTYSKWINLQYQTRFILQQMKRSSGVKTVVNPWNTAGKMPAHRIRIKKDWSSSLEAGNVQPNTFPAKFSLDTTAADCAADFVVFPTARTGARGRASIIAYSNLYSGCGGTVPSVYWAYNTSVSATTTDTITLSPILYTDGVQVAFIQVTGATASLVLLKGLQAPTPPTGVTGTFANGSTTVTIVSGTVTAADVGLQISGTSMGL
jgi:hypothetical protein